MKNPVAKNQHKFNKSSVMVDKKKESRKNGSHLNHTEDYSVNDTMLSSEEYVIVEVNKYPSLFATHSRKETIEFIHETIEHLNKMVV